MDYTSASVRRCGKCGAKYVESMNIGALECTDIYYSNSGRSSLLLEADHMPSRGDMGRTVHNWMDWVWELRHNIRVEGSIFKQFVKQPRPEAIFNEDEFAMLMARHEQKIIAGEKQLGTISKSFVPSDDDSGDYSYEEIDDTDDDMGVVTIARFDWRKKFSVLQQIKEIDDAELERKDVVKRGGIYYWDTIEYKHNPEKQIEFKRMMTKRFT